MEPAHLFGDPSLPAQVPWTGTGDTHLLVCPGPEGQTQERRRDGVGSQGAPQVVCRAGLPNFSNRFPACPCTQSVPLCPGPSGLAAEH